MPAHTHLANPKDLAGRLRTSIFAHQSFTKTGGGAVGAVDQSLDENMIADVFTFSPLGEHLSMRYPGLTNREALRRFATDLREVMRRLTSDGDLTKSFHFNIKLGNGVLFSDNRMTQFLRTRAGGEPQERVFNMFKRYLYMLDQVIDDMKYESIFSDYRHYTIITNLIFEKLMG